MDVRSHEVWLDVWNFINGAIVYGARATQPRQEWVQFPHNPFKKFQTEIWTGKL